MYYGTFFYNVLGLYIQLGLFVCLPVTMITEENNNNKNWLSSTIFWINGARNKKSN